MMRIAEETPDRLTLEEKPWILGIALIVMILAMLLVATVTLAENIWLGIGMILGAGLFGVAFATFVRRVIVIFDRPAGAVVIRVASLRGQSEKTLALADIRAVIVETSISRTSRSNGRRTVSRTHRPALDTPTGPVALTEVYSGGDGAAQVAKAVNRWLGLPDA